MGSSFVSASTKSQCFGAVDPKNIESGLLFMPNRKTLRLFVTIKIPIPCSCSIDNATNPKNTNAHHDPKHPLEIATVFSELKSNNCGV
jgi:hypothetical protein